MFKNTINVNKKNKAGFTLLELLLAVFIFALISTGAYQIFNIAQRNASLIQEKQNRIRDVSLSLELIEKDFTQLSPRFWRDPFSDALTPSLQTDYSDNYLVRLIRSGWRNPLGTNRSEQQAVTYRIEDDKLLREYTQHLDNISSTKATQTILIDRVNNINLRYLDRNNGEWTENWPPNSAESQSTIQNPSEQAEQVINYLPIAVEFTIDLEDFGQLVSVIALSPGA